MAPAEGLWSCALASETRVFGAMSASDRFELMGRSPRRDLKCDHEVVSVWGLGHSPYDTPNGDEPPPPPAPKSKRGRGLQKRDAALLISHLKYVRGGWG